MHPTIRQLIGSRSMRGRVGHHVQSRKTGVSGSCGVRAIRTRYQSKLSLGAWPRPAAENIHEFWPDKVSLLDSDVVDSTRIHGPRQLTDIYLLALAVQHEGRLVTFDNGIPLAAVRRATRQNMLIL